MIEIEYIIDGTKSLLTIRFNSFVMNHLKSKCNDNLNFIQSQFKLNFFTLFKADTGYKITRVPRSKKIYQIRIRHKIQGLNECEATLCTYYLKKNGFIKILIKGNFR